MTLRRSTNSCTIERCRAGSPPSSPTMRLTWWPLTPPRSLTIRLQTCSASRPGPAACPIGPERGRTVPMVTGDFAVPAEPPTGASGKAALRGSAASPPSGEGVTACCADGWPGELFPTVDRPGTDPDGRPAGGAGVPPPELGRSAVPVGSAAGAMDDVAVPAPISALAGPGPSVTAGLEPTD